MDTENSGRQKGTVADENLQALRIVQRANHLFQRLRDAGTERDKSGNRTLLFSHYASLILLSMFNPTMQSLRGLQSASEIKRVQKRLGCGRASLGSLSESNQVFDPELLVPLIQELLDGLSQNQSGPGPRRTIPEEIPLALAKKLVAVDGSALRALPQIVGAVAKTQGDGQWKIHLHFRALTGRPEKFTVTRDQVEGEGDERDVLAENLEPNCVYIADRGFERYTLYNSIVSANSAYVIRNQHREVEVIESRDVSPAARAARVISDEIIRPSPHARSTSRLNHTVRRIIIAKRDQGRPRADRKPSNEIILYTNLIDVPAEVIAAIYELRWTIELFFRFLKQILGCRRLLSNKPNGVAIQIYCALIACLLLAQTTGGRVTMDAYRLICFYLQGWADDEELLAGLHKIQQRELRSGKKG
jgi:Transposase DDE domain